MFYVAYNRSAAHFYLQNWRSSLRDSEQALKLQPKHEKSLLRASRCCRELDRWEQCIQFCDEILTQRPEHEEALSLRQHSIRAAAASDRDKRKRRIAEERIQANHNSLITKILSRGIKVDASKDGLTIEHLEPKFPELAQSTVSLDENDCLIWPVMLMFPEHKMTEFVQRWPETDPVEELLNMVLAEAPPWDPDRKYTVQNVNVYFENKISTTLHKIALDSPLGDILTHKRYEQF